MFHAGVSSGWTESNGKCLLMAASYRSWPEYKIGRKERGKRMIKLTESKGKEPKSEKNELYPWVSIENGASLPLALLPLVVFCFGV